MAKKDLPIGVFDSGVGGLGVVNTLSKNFPEEDFIYIADSKNFPYGTKSEKEIKEFSERIVKYLLHVKVKAIVVACNTVSSIAIPHLKKISGGVPVFGMIQSGAELAVEKTKNARIGVISTPLTAKMHAYRKEILRLNRNAMVIEIGSQELVNLVEDGNQENRKAFKLVNEKLSKIISMEADTLILGCTHFPFLYKVVKAVVQDRMEIIDPADNVSNKLRNYLRDNGLLKKESNTRRMFLTTGDEVEFLQKARVFLNIDVNDVKHLDI